MPNGCCDWITAGELFWFKTKFRDWLIPIFIPSKPEEHANRRTEMVIDGKAVEVFDTEKVLGEAAADSKASAIQRQVRR